MLGKVWKKFLLLILIIACLFDITLKLVKRNSLKNELESTIKYFNKTNTTYNAYSESSKEGSKENSNLVAPKNDRKPVNIQNSAMQ